MLFFDVLRFDRDSGKCLHDRDTPSPLPFTQRGVPAIIKSMANALHLEYECNEVSVNLSTLDSNTDNGVLAYYNQLKRSDSKGVVAIYVMKQVSDLSITDFFNATQSQQTCESPFERLTLTFALEHKNNELKLLANHQEFLIFFIKNEYVAETHLSQSPSAFLSQLTPRRYSSDRSNSCDSPRFKFD
mgnify:CR=1 FL=1